MRKVYFDIVHPFFCQVVTLAKGPKTKFKELLSTRGYDAELADLLWKWYDFTEKKGVASF